MKVYLSGIMQGSRKDEFHVSQDYRKVIKAIVLRRFPYAEVICPLEEFPNASTSAPFSAKAVISACANLSANSDLVVAFLPEASMGTAVELWEAFKNSKPIITISPMAQNLVIRTVSSIIVRDIEEFQKVMSNGVVEKILTMGYVSIESYNNNGFVERDDRSK